MLNQISQYYNFKNPEFIFIRHNENMTYEVRDGENKYLLRIHNAADGLNFSFQCGDTPRSEFVKSEIELLLKLYSDSNIPVQRPVANKYGEYVTKLESGDYATILSWFEGETLKNIPITNEIVYQIGVLIARLQNDTSRFEHIKRYSYDEIMLDRVSAEFKIAYEREHINKRHYDCMISYLNEFTKMLKKEKRNFILVHADVSKSNLIYHENQIVPIDFSLSGYALPEMDLSDMLCDMNDNSLKPYLLDGYKSVSKFEISDLRLDAYSAFSVAMYIAYHHEKFYMDEKSQKSLDRWTDTIFQPVIEKLKIRGIFTMPKNS